jgi:CRISPR-associated protein Cas6
MPLDNAFAKYDVSFKVVNSGIIPWDHGYFLFSAISPLVPELHLENPAHQERSPLHLLSIRGKQVLEHYLQLQPYSKIVIRSSLEHLSKLEVLQRAQLNLGGFKVSLGAPEVRPVLQAKVLDSPRVFIRATSVLKTKEDTLDIKNLRQGFEAEATKQLTSLGVQCKLEVRGNQSLLVKDTKFVCFSVRLTDFGSPEQSVIVQEKGIGAKHTMGCGVFTPTPERFLK